MTPSDDDAELDDDDQDDASRQHMKDSQGSFAIAAILLFTTLLSFGSQPAASGSAVSSV